MPKPFAENIGPFSRTEDFVSAVPRILQAIPAAAFDTGYVNRRHPLGDVRAAVGRNKMPAALIIASFLDAVALDAERFLLSGTRVNDTPVILSQPTCLTMSVNAGPVHADFTVRDLVLQARYLTTNCCPTHVPSLGPLHAGTITRLVLGETKHQQPRLELTASQPRVLLSIDM